MTLKVESDIITSQKVTIIAPLKAMSYSKLK